MTNIKKLPMQGAKTTAPKKVASSKTKKVSPDMVKLMNDINKKFGNNALCMGVPETGVIKIERIPTGIIPLDIALGGGIPIGRFTHISGALSSTKTTIALHIIKEAQKMGLVCAMEDAEGTTDDAYMSKIGVDPYSVLYSRPDGLEECTQMILDFQRSGKVDLALFDSIEASPPTKEYNSGMEDVVQLGIKQKLLSEFFRKYQAGNNRLVREGKRPFTLIGLNQLRDKIGGYGDSEFYTGGRSIGFTCSVDLRLRKGDWITEGTGDNKETVGQVVKFRVEKNKTYKRMQDGEIDFYFAKNAAEIPEGHFDNFKSIVLEAVDWNLITRGGAWYYLDEEKNLKFNGVDALIAYLREHEGLVYEMRDKIIQLATPNR